MKVKVRALEYNDKMDFVFPSWVDACQFMMDAANNHVPHEQYARDELYPIRFEVELAPDQNEAICDDDFNELEELVNGEPDELEVEDVKEGE